MDAEAIRLDKWLWAARFYKTRSQATDAISGGKVHLNNNRIKPAHRVSVGDEIKIHKGESGWIVRVLVLSDHRGPATFAQTLYQETPESIEAGQKNRQERTDLPFISSAKPNKKDRRALGKIKRFLD